MIRVPFTCQQNTLSHETQTATVVLTAAITNPPSEITLQITNPEASAQFSQGTNYYVDFTPV